MHACFLGLLCLAVVRRGFFDFCSTPSPTSLLNTAESLHRLMTLKRKNYLYFYNDRRGISLCVSAPPLASLPSPTPRARMRVSLRCTPSLKFGSTTGAATPLSQPCIRHPRIAAGCRLSLPLQPHPAPADRSFPPSGVAVTSTLRAISVPPLAEVT